MSVLSKEYFHNEAAAFEHVERILWPKGPVCPHCGNDKRIYKLEGVRSKPSKKNPEGVERHGLKKCAACRKQFTVRIGTIFEESHIPLHKWLQAIHLMCSSKKGISSNQLHRVLEITLKSAWFLSHRIREAMRTGVFDTPLGGNGKIVEADETFIGRKKGFQKKGGGAGHKMTVMSLVERGGDVRSVVLDRITKVGISKVIADNVHHESRLMTDTASYYMKRDFNVAGHEMVNHYRGEYVREDVYTNTLEGFYSIFKRGMKGVYQHCAEKHLHRYAAEFDFRYNNRTARGVNDSERAMNALIGVSGKRLTYDQANPAGQAL
ncbi:IS1595 family transposase [Pseudohoeflea coraliihabitans]|uniref:IS1595 family transposase n=1 Tax=Pseudohoeflea coraliihabitans TaxID=2860393 RepID=A0ABS6WT78_9HYPH|nr:IS1595 family transposase [Pseudohoeflea sp. DP4N28-3]MBW3099161.1 IS1595 family transposase [Pseudohoeflea sp. DP4N28-3]